MGGCDRRAADHRRRGAAGSRALTRARLRPLAVALAAALACGDDGSGPRAGVLRVQFTTANAGSDGAVLFTVTGPAAPRSATAASGLRVFHESLGNTTKFVVTGPLVAGAILTIEVDDVGRAGEYAAVIHQVAANTYQLRALVGYSLTVSQ